MLPYLGNFKVPNTKYAVSQRFLCLSYWIFYCFKEKEFLYGFYYFLLSKGYRNALEMSINIYYIYEFAEQRLEYTLYLGCF